MINVARTLGLAIAYAVAALVCLRLQIPGTGAAPVWVPSALVAAAAVRWGAVAVPGAYLGAMVGNVLGAVVAPVYAPLMALGHAAQAAIVWRGMRGREPTATHYPAVVALVLGAGLVSALWGSVWVAVAHGAPVAGLVSAVPTWALADAGGLLLGVAAAAPTLRHAACVVGTLIGVRVASYELTMVGVRLDELHLAFGAACAAGVGYAVALVPELRRREDALAAEIERRRAAEEAAASAEQDFAGALVQLRALRSGHG